MRVLMALLAVAVLAGCGPKPPPVPVTDLCGASGFQHLTGLKVSSLPQPGPWSSLRIIRPGMMVTMDYSATRLNAQVDRAGRILALSCG